MSSYLFNMQKAQQGTLDWAGDALKLALVGPAFSPDPAAATLDAALGASEVSGSGYSRRALAGKSVVRDDVLNEARFYADDVLYEGANFGTVTGGIVYREIDPGDDALNVPVAYCELDTPVATGAGALTFRFNPEGVFKTT